MVAEAASATAVQSRQSDHASSSSCCCCFCRHSCCCRSLDHTAHYASMVVLAASVAAIFARVNTQRGQMHSFHSRRFYYCHRRDRYFLKKSRKSRWEWRPVTRRSTWSQTSVEVVPEDSPVITEIPSISLDDFPSLSRSTLLEHKVPNIKTATTDNPITTTTKQETPTLKEETTQQPLNRKQRKYLKKKQKKLFAASHTLQISSLPILKPWKSPSSSSQTPCKIYDCSKTFGPLGSPSAKSITWSFSSPSSGQKEDTGKATVKPEISEISESPKSYLGDWTDSESSKRSQSDAEEIEMEAPSFDSEFEADSEDYSFQAS